MSVVVVAGDRYTTLVCDTTDQAFGPAFYREYVAAIREWVRDHQQSEGRHGRDLRRLAADADTDLRELFREWKMHHPLYGEMHDQPQPAGRRW